MCVAKSSEAEAKREQGAEPRLPVGPTMKCTMGVFVQLEIIRRALIGFDVSQLVDEEHR